MPECAAEPAIQPPKNKKPQRTVSLTAVISTALPGSIRPERAEALRL